MSKEKIATIEIEGKKHLVPEAVAVHLEKLEKDNARLIKILEGSGDLTTEEKKKEVLAADKRKKEVKK